MIKNITSSKKIIALFLVILTPMLTKAQDKNIEKTDIEYSESAFKTNYDSLLTTYFQRKNIEHIEKKHYTKETKYHHVDFEDIPDSVLFKRLLALPTVVPFKYNSTVRSYIRMYVKRMNNNLNTMLSLSEYYFPFFEEALERYNLPQELKYLAITESALNPQAVSRVGATGLWQFMHGTGKIYGLTINSLVDERHDPLKSSDAAARYLRDLYDIFDDWTLAIAAYNCGPKNVNKAITRSGGRRSFWEIYNYLPRETRGYIPDYTAATYIMNYYEKHGLKPNNISVPIETDTLNITKNLFFGQITKFIDIDITQLKILNPQYKENIIPGENMHCYLRLPIEHIPQFIRLQDSIFEFGKDSLVQEIVQEIRPMEQITHIVRKNETWSKIAKKYGVSVNQLRKWNPRLKNTLRIGQRMIIQRNNPLYKQIKQSAPKLIEKTAKAEKDTVMTAESKIENTNNANAKNDNVSTTKKEKYHTVKSGDSLYSIAKKYKTTVNKLRALNNFKSQTLQIGQKVRVQ